MRVVHLEEEGFDEEVGAESKDLDGINGLTEEFIIPLARIVKEGPAG